MKGYRDNGSGAGGFGARSKTVYDDVFGGPPKFGATTLPPRIEDYTEIFQGFHASRGSSIPVLDLPPPALNSDDVWFDVSSSKLDYSEVFGGFNGLDFAYSYEELFDSSKVAEDDSSDDVWTPAQSESLSEESDPQASLEANQQVSTADRNQSSGMDLKNKPNFEADKDFLNGMTDDSQCLDVSGSVVLDNQVLPTKTENESYFSLVNNNICASKDFGEAAEEKKLKKSLSQPLDRPLVYVSGLSLKTQPSNLPPPSRPPPALTLKKGDSSNFTSKLKTSKSYAFDRMTVDQSPPFFDVEIDASSSAAADAAAMKDAVEQAQAKLKSAKALMDRKKKVKEYENYEKSDSFEGEKMKRLFESDSGITRHKVRDENQQNHQTAVILAPNAGFIESKNNNNIVFEYFEQKEESEILQETVDRSHKTPNDSDENEMFENLIEIQLKDNDIVTMEKVVTETWFKNDDNEIKGDDMGPASNVWVDYDVEPEESTKKTEKQYEKEFQQAGSPDMSSIHSKEEVDSEEEGERIVKESDNISETVSEQNVNKKKQTLDHDEKLLSAEERIKTEIDDDVQTVNEKIETTYEVDCNSEENIKLQESVFENESIKWDEDESITGENFEVPDVVFQVDNNEILQHKENVQQDTDSEKHEVTPQIPFSEKINETVEQIQEIRTADGTKQTLVENNNNKKASESPATDQDTNTASRVSENRIKEERIQSARELETRRLKRLEEERETESLRKLEEERETERLRKLEEERETERLRKLEEERETERLRKLVEERETERLRKLEEERETERLRKLEEERETERLRKLEEERETERLRKLEEERETERLRKLEEERETERLRKLEEERETERLRKLEEERETERLRKLEEERETERLRKLEEERETDRLRKLEEERETERLRKLEEERERQIEREKDRMAVDRATLEAREKTFAETRERAAVERATAEFRQRALAEARERLEKACAEARERSLADKAMEGRLRVEKATAEARERAVADKFLYQNTGIRQNSLPSDLSGSYSGLRYYQAPSQGGEDESPQRCKARLERHQRTADRAAKALAEKNMRDLIAQKEQAERSRLAEGLDAEVKRWSSGKQGNLRALLSTLQYILGPDSGWQPVPLTEVITTAAVKKAYRKATLCVHPDKLQQRGATIQQKYICEKVFDLLKEAWNKFNSEER